MPPRPEMTPPDAVARWIAGIPFGAGVLLMCISVFDPRDGAFDAGRAPVAFAGLAFAGAGVAVFINSLRTEHKALLLTINGTVLLASLACVPLAIAWHDGASWPLVAGAVACLSLAGVGVRAALRERRRVQEGRRR